MSQEQEGNDPFVSDPVTNYFTTQEFNDYVTGKTSNMLSMIHLNIRSMRNKFDDLLTYLNSIACEFSVIALTETWLNENDYQDNFEIPGYNTHKLNRKNKVGGGICIFTKDHLKTKLRNDLINETSLDNCESLFLEIENAKNKNVIIGTIYRPPNNRFYDFEGDLKAILSKLEKSDKPTYIMGDFNIDLLRYDKCSFSNHFYNHLASSGYTPLITKPTRVTESTASLIDNIYANTLNLNEHLNGILFSDLSDHLPIFTITNFKLNLDNIKLDNNIFGTRLINKRSLESFSCELQKRDWAEVLSKYDPIISYDVFISDFLKLYCKCFPLKKLNMRNTRGIKNPWATNGLIKSCKTKEKLYKIFLNNPTTVNEKQYKVYRNKLNHLIGISKKHYFGNKFNQAQNNSKLTWNAINELLRKNQSNKVLPNSFMDNDDELNEPEVIANKFNEFFVNVGPNLAKNFNKNSDEFYKYLEGNYENSMFLNYTTSEEVNRVIDNL